MSEELPELKQQMKLLSDDQLLQIITVDAGEYRKDALDCAKAELINRGIDVEEESGVALHEEENEMALDLDSHGRICLICGGQLRPGTLVAEKELTIVFDETREERFVKVNACSQCGQLSMIVDFENEVGH